MIGKIQVRAALLVLFLLWLVAVGLANAAPPPARPAVPAPPAAPADTATLILNPIADSYVVLSSTTNYGSAGDMHVDYDANSHVFSRALMQFSMADLAYQLPAGATVVTATLKLHMSADALITETLTIHTGSGADWGEDTVNWNNQPTWGPPGVALTVSPIHGDKVWDVTPLLQGWLNGSLSNHGLGLLGPESGPNTYSFIFDSRTGTNPPQLEITYQLPPPTVPPPTEIPIPPHPPLVNKAALVLSDDTATAGTQLRVTGFGFPTDLCSRYDTFMIQNSQAPVLMGGTEPSEGDITTLVITVPVSAKGNYNVVTLGGGHQAATHLVVTPTAQSAASGPVAPAVVSTASLSANPTSGAPGSRVTVSGSGFTGPGCSPVNFYWQQYLSSGAVYFASVGAGQLSGGAVSYSFAVPNISNGSAILWAVGPNNTVATTIFTVCCQAPPPPPPPNPVTVSTCAGADTYVASNQPNPTNSTDLNVGHSYNNVQQSDDFSLSLVRFDLSSIPVGATVNQASFQLNLLNSQQASGLSSVQIGVLEMNASWPENNFTWAQLDNLSPYTTRELSRQTVGSSPGATYAWNVTAAAQDWVDSPGANYGLSVEDVGGLFGSSNNYNRAFFGRESGSSTCPRLTITYDPSTAGNDLYVGGVDLVQANGRPVFLPYARTSQTVNADASPIAGKSTMLRVFPGTANTLSQVTGSVSGFPCGSNSALAGSPLMPVDGPIVAVPSPDVTQRNAALNFVLPSSWLSGCIDLSMTLTSLGEPESASKLANNTARWNNINFQTTQTLNLVLIPLQNIYSGAKTSATDPQVGTILAWLNAVYPLADGDIYYRYTPVPLLFNESLPGDGSSLIDDLEVVRDSIRGMPANTRYIGLNPSTSSRAGMARNSGRTSPTAGNVAYVSMEPLGAPAGTNDPEFYGSTWAQEIAHLFGRMHASNAHGESSGGPVDCQFPSWNAYFGHGGIGSYGVAFNTETWNSTSTAFQPNDFVAPGTQANHAHDFMSYGNTPNWVSPYTFDALARAFNYLPPLTGRQCGSSLQAQAARNSSATGGTARPTAPALVDLIRLSGHIYPDHSVAWQAAFHSQDVAPVLGTIGDYSLELRDITDTVLLTDYFNGEQNMHVDTASVTFSELLPWQAGTARIVLKHHDYVLAEQVVSANAPSVTVTAPTSGQSVGSQLTVQWQGNDPDGGLLTYAVLYNTGTNAEWWPIITGVTATAGSPLSYTVPTDLLAGSTQAHVKVLVSDGIHGGESTSAAFSLPKKAPIVAILYPPDNIQWTPTEDHPLLGSAYDAQDGSLSGAALVWTSDRDGVLGQGSHLHVHLSPGIHHLTLTAKDADGRQDTASVTVTVVLYKVDLPLVRR